MNLRMHAGALLALALVAGGCGSSDEPDGDPSAAGDATSADPEPAPEESGEEESGEEESASTGDGSAVLTMADGTVYELVLTSCDTQDTKPSGFPLSNGYDVTGKTADGEFGFSAGRAGFDDEDVFMSGLLEGDFDDEGKNSAMLYNVDTQTLDLTASGSQVSGTLDFRAIGPTRPHGDEASGTLEASC